MAKQKIELKQHILEDIRLHPNSSSREIDDRLKGAEGKATKYTISKAFELINSINVEQYFQKEINERQIKTQFNHTLITETSRTCFNILHTTFFRWR